MGGSIARLTDAGHSVHVASLGNGVGSRGGSEDELTQEVIARGRAFHKACGILGATCEVNICYPVFPDQMADTVPQLEINRAVGEIVATRKPDVMYTHFDFDRNVDHRHVADAVITEARRICPVFAAEPEWPSRALMPFNGTPHDITKTLARKLKACRVYATEMRAYPDPRSERAIRERAEKWGGPSAGVYAEAFMEIR